MGGDGRALLGVFVADHARTIVVSSRDGELAVALRELVPPQSALVRDVRPHECRAAIKACRPWPWMLVGEGDALPAAAAADVAARAIVVIWLGIPPARLPRHARVVASYAELARCVQSALQASVAGLRLSPYRGVQARDGKCVRCAPLEALIAIHPDGFALPLRAFRSTTAPLERLRVNARADRDAQTRRIRLVSADPVDGGVA